MKCREKTAALVVVVIVWALSSFAGDGATAWFDELLANDAYGTCRGSGVLLLTESGWRIAQYNLSIPIPNELAAKIVAVIRAGGSK